MHHLRSIALCVALASVSAPQDGLTGSPMNLSSGFLDDHPDVGNLDAEYLVVWERAVDPTRSEIVARRVDGSSGAPVGPEFPVRAAADVVAARPSVAPIGGVDRYLVVWQERQASGSTFALRAACVDAGAAVAGASVVVAPAGVSQLEPDAGGDRGSGTTALVTWDEEGVGIRACRVDVPASGAPAPSAAVATLSTDAAGTDSWSPAVTEVAGAGGRHLVTFTRREGADLARVRGVVVDASGNPLGGGHVDVSGSSLGRDAGCSGVGGDGERWTVAFETYSSASASTFDRIRAVDLEWTGAALSVGSSQGLANAVAGGATPAPRLGWTGDLTAVCLSRLRVGSGSVPRVQEVDGYLGQACAFEEVSTGAGSVGGVDLASAWSGGAAADEQGALLAWSFGTGSGTTGIVVQLHRGPGAGGDLGGGCGPGGALFAPCPTAGQFLWLKLLDAASGNAVILATSPMASPGFACGSCTFYPTLTPALNLRVLGQIPSGGDLVNTTLLPSTLSGVSAVLQMATVHGGEVNVCPLFPSVSLSNARTITIR